MTEVLHSNIETDVVPEPNQYELGNHELPIALRRTEIETAIYDNSVTIIVAPTGSGKTTQVAQFAREMKNDGYDLFDQIIVTQPRIVAARTVSERVRDEISESKTSQHHSVGYYTSKEATLAPQDEQDIAFLTDGKAAVQLLHQSKLTKPKANRLLIIDEVHEWNLNTEQLIAIATEKTDPDSALYDPTFKAVIMSATMDSDKLRDHFKHLHPPLIEITVPTYPVSKTITDRSVASMGLVLAAKSKGKVLAFFPGKREIKKAAELVAKKQETSSSRVEVIALHGQQTAKQQRRAFRDYSKGAIIATTNAAETSITVPGAIAVVDSGEVRTDRISYELIPEGSEGLYLEDASQANLDQRKGRVGRTAPGEYILCSPDGKTPAVPYGERYKYATPAMQRTRLDGLLLRLKATNYAISDFRFFHQPPAVAIASAEKRLFTLGAIKEDGSITDRGLQMETLPLDPEYSCMLAFALEKKYNNQVVQHVIDIAAIMQLGGILKRAPKEQNWRELLATNARGETKEMDSDFIAQHEAYVELTDNIERIDWAKYDIIEHAAGLVEQTRASLAERLHVSLQKSVAIDPNNRRAVLTCINAGQLNQLWQRSGNGENWSLESGNGKEFQISESSVAGKIGEFVTGSLFSLGLRNDVIHSIQDVNRVVLLESLEQAAGHMIIEENRNAKPQYDPETGQLTVNVNRRLGNIILRTARRVVEVEADSPESQLISKGHQEHAWANWSEHRKVNSEYNLQTISDAINNPEQAQYAVDPISGEPLLAWKGANSWCTTREIAVESLEACQKRLTNKPKETELRALKAEINDVTNQMLAIKRNGLAVDDIKKLLSLKKKHDKQQWLALAKNIVDNN